jgi:hypothetical protein
MNDSISLSSLPALGQELLGGIFAGLATTPAGAHAAVVLLADKPSELLHWKDAMAWAEGLGAVLPTRPVAALLFANVKAQFEADWHWTADQYGASYAWICHFITGHQFFTRRSAEGAARAVRLIPLTV